MDKEEVKTMPRFFAGVDVRPEKIFIAVTDEDGDAITVTTVSRGRDDDDTARLIVDEVLSKQLPLACVAMIGGRGGSQSLFGRVLARHLTGITERFWYLVNGRCTWDEGRAVVEQRPELKMQEHRAIALALHACWHWS